MSRKSPMVIALAVLLLCLLCLPCVRSVAAPVPDTPVSPLAATGRPPLPRESAEEILARAHQRDATAMVLAVAGYSQGVGGFPKSRYLAGAWGAQLVYLGAADSLSVATLLLWPVTERAPENLPQRLADCVLARESALFPAFEQAGLLDAKSLCAQWEKENDRQPGWEKAYEQRIRERKAQKEAAREAMTIMRELRRRPATAKDMDRLRKGLALEISRFRDAARQDPAKNPIVQTLLFYAATTHDPDCEASDWSPDRLLEFMIAQLATARTLSGEIDKPGEFPRFADLVSEAGEAFRTGVYVTLDPSLESIRSAHSGDLGGAYAMSEAYRSGSFGFIKDQALAVAWLQHAALGGNTRCMLFLAADRLAAGNPAEAWPWAWIAEKVEVESADVQGLARRIRQTAEAGASERELLEARNTALVFLREHKEWIERYKAAQKNDAPPAPQPGKAEPN